MTKAKNPGLLIVTSDFKHPTFHRLHMFLPYLSAKFDVAIINLQKDYLITDREGSGRVIGDFIQFLLVLLKVIVGKSQSVDGVYTVIIPRIKGGLLLSFLAAPLLIRKLAKEKNVRAVWGLGPVAGYSVLLSHVGVPFVYDDSDRHYFFYDNTLMRMTMMRIEKACISTADVVTSAGPSLLESSRKIRGANGTVVFLPNSLDITKYSNNSGGLTKPYDLIYIGIVDEWCGLHFVLEAVELLISHLPEFNLLVVGPIQEGYYRRLEEIVSKSGLFQHVHFIGRKDHSEVLRHLGQSSVGIAVYPRTHLMEYAFTIKLLEYMAAGLAVVASDVGDTAEIVRRANCGIVVEPRPGDIAKAIVELMQDDGLRRHFGECGRKYVSQNYNIATISRKLIHLFESLENMRTYLAP